MPFPIRIPEEEKFHRIKVALYDQGITNRSLAKKKDGSFRWPSMGSTVMRQQFDKF
jgi:hypothetical protein